MEAEEGANPSYDGRTSPVPVGRPEHSVPLLDSVSTLGFTPSRLDYYDTSVLSDSPCTNGLGLDPNPLFPLPQYNKSGLGLG